jgi:hypothetical protein
MAMIIKLLFYSDGPGSIAVILQAPWWVFGAFVAAMAAAVYVRLEGRGRL